MKCKYCKNKSLIRKGKTGIKQRYLCKSCGKYQQDIYTYSRYNAKDDKNIKQLNAEGVGIRSMGRQVPRQKRIKHSVTTKFTEVQYVKGEM